MDYNQFIARENRFSRKPQSDLDLQTERRNNRLDNQHRFSQPKGRMNLIKINKNKLPGDFFIKKDSQSRRTITSKFHLQQQLTEPCRPFHKAESERLHYSPQKTSFFGFFQEHPQQSPLKTSGNSKIYNRKFQTREESKRQNFPVQSARKLTTATKNGKNELIDLFPSTIDDHLTEIIISTKTKNLKGSPRKEYHTRMREPVLLNDPEKQIVDRGEKQGRQIREGRKLNGATLRDISMSEPVRENESLNITFFNAKSTCFPPINRNINQ